MQPRFSSELMSHFLPLVGPRLPWRPPHFLPLLPSYYLPIPGLTHAMGLFVGASQLAHVASSKFIATNQMGRNVTFFSLIERSLSPFVDFIFTDPQVLNLFTLR